MLTSLEFRRNKALRCIAEYQDRFAKQEQEVSDRVIEGKVWSSLKIGRPGDRLDRGNRAADRGKST